MSATALLTGRAKVQGDVVGLRRLVPWLARSIPRYKKYREAH
jgi:hypothetical protein